MAQAEQSNSISRRSALALSIAAMAAGPALAQDADPVFAAIAKHRKANLEFYASLVVAPSTLNPDPNLEEEFGELERDARLELTGTVPTSMAGLAAMFEYINDVSTGKATGKADCCFAEEELLDVALNAHEFLQGAFSKI